MKIDSNTILVFLISIFLLLTITSAGMSLNDEWMTAAQLNQLYQGHQIVYNEGKYGYYANGTPSVYMSYRHNILMYPLALPIMALPMMFILSIFGDGFRLMIVGAWIAIGGLALIKILEKRPGNKYTIPMIVIFLIVILANLILYKEFPFIGEFVPAEVMALILTNIILFGILSAITYVTSKELFGDNLKAWLATGATMICSSVIFWSGTAKDHTLTILLIAIVILSLIKFVKARRKSLLVVAAATSGILTWVRPEVGIGIMGAVILCALLFSYQFGKGQAFKHIAVVTTVMLISLTPFVANNFIVTGSIFKTPFQASNPGYDDITTTTHYFPPDTMYMSETNMSENRAGPYIGKNIVPTLVAPTSGAAGLLAIIPLAAVAFFAIPEILRRKFVKKERIWILTYPERVLAIVAISSMAFHIYRGTFLLQHLDTGIFPDLRYFSPMYGAITFLAISVLYRTFDINVKKAIKNTMLFSLLAVILIMGLVVLFPSYLSSQAHFNTLISACAVASLGLSAILMLNDVRGGTRYMGLIVIPLLIAIPFSWNFITTFIYSGTKMVGYPMILPMSQFLYDLMFGLL